MDNSCNGWFIYEWETLGLLYLKHDLKFRYLHTEEVYIEKFVSYFRIKEQLI